MNTEDFLCTALNPTSFWRITMPIWNRQDVLISAWKRDWYKFLEKRCTQRILIVTDTSGSFDPANSTGLTELIRVLKGSGDVPAAVPATVTEVSKASGFNFSTASPAVTTANYDQVWLFGFQAGAPSSDANEIRVLAQFMESGGGVFATGDHSDIGRPLCGALPRIRKMREWAAVPMGGPTRIDTVNNPGIDGVARSSDQSDRFPQTMYPLLDASSAPHPLLRSPAGAINVLPDHPHESECYAPRGTNLTGNFSVAGLAPFTEFPTVGGLEHGPQLVAISMSASLNADKLPVTPRCFGAISAYDGHLANKGRVVCDSTWHHFVNMNLNASNPYGDSGLREGTPPVANAAYKQIQHYFANIADYLTPKNRKWCRIYDMIVVELFDYPIWEEIVVLPEPPRPFPDFPEWPRAIELGKLVKASLSEKFGNGAFDGLIEDVLDVAETGKEVRFAINNNLRLLTSQNKEQSMKQYDDPVGIEELKLGLIGRVFLALKAQLPDNPAELPKSAERLHDSGAKLLGEIVAKGLAEGLKYREMRYRRDLELINTLR
ncbi:MAG: hypothetical protein NTW51_02945 [Cyanobacteria bacterium]|nr:hypothetical protein [Cyanobacteriota bacterium]